jgi:outer membrane protein assembly factor BamB
MRKIRRWVLLCFAFWPVVLVADDWPQWLGPNRDSVWRETGIVEKFPSGGPKVIWRTAIGAGYAGPSVAAGKVYLTDRKLGEGAKNPTNAFDRSVVPGSERVICLNEADGKQIWKYEYDCPYSISYGAGPRVTPLVTGGKVYSLGAEGNLVCLDAATGKLVWAHEFKKEYNAKTPLWGIAGNPLLVGNKLICLAGGEGAVVVAFDKDSGKEAWHALTAKEPGYSSPMLCTNGGKAEVIVWHPESVNALNPETGEVYWSEPFSSKSGMTIATPRQIGDELLVTTFYSGSMMLRLKDQRTVSPMWKTQKASEKETTHLNAVMCTPFLENGYIYGVCSYGQLRCLKGETGERVWETFKATTDGEPVRWANAFIVKNGDRFFLANEKGDLVIARLTPQAYTEVSRCHLLEPTNTAAGRDVVWSHPAFANRHVYARNDKEIVCADLAE